MSTVVLERWCPRVEVGGGRAIVGRSSTLIGVCEMDVEVCVVSSSFAMIQDCVLKLVRDEQGSWQARPIRAEAHFAALTLVKTVKIASNVPHLMDFDAQSVMLQSPQWYNVSSWRLYHRETCRFGERRSLDLVQIGLVKNER